MTIKETAKALKVTENTVKTWIIDDCPYDIIDDNGRLTYEFDLRELQIWLFERGCKNNEL